MASKTAFPKGKPDKLSHWNLLNLGAVERCLGPIGSDTPTYETFKAFCVELRQCRFDLAHLSRRSGIHYTGEGRWLIQATDWVIERLSRFPNLEWHDDLVEALDWHRDELLKYADSRNLHSVKAEFDLAI